MKLVALIALGIVLAAAVAFAAPAQAWTPPGSWCTPKGMSGVSCKAFKDRARTARYVRQLLLANGFHSAGLRVWLGGAVKSTQKISYTGVQDGTETWGEVFKTGDHRLWITFTWMDPDLGRSTGTSQTIKTSFVP
jgi:hypothetical protein